MVAVSSAGPHANPVWSTFIFVTGMLLFLFYLESMINPMDVLESKSFVMKEYYQIRSHPTSNHSVFVNFGDVFEEAFDLRNPESTLVAISIQETAEKAFTSHVTHDLDLRTGYRCNCTTGSDPSSVACPCRVHNDRHQLFFNKLTKGWPCGVYPGWTDLTLACLDNAMYRTENKNTARRYARVTMLRDPLVRYVHEWYEVATHGQRQTDGVQCHPLSGTTYLNGTAWIGVTLDWFLRCPDNPANNRQVRMLADISHVTCYKVREALTRNGHQAKSDGDRVANISWFLLESAMENLRQMPYFGLVEFLQESDQLFENTFHVRFVRDFAFNEKELSIQLTAEQKEIIANLNRLDTQLYAFGRSLFFERLANISRLRSKQLDPL